MDKSEFADTQGQLSVGMLLGTVYEHTSGTVHGLNGIIHVIYDRCVHLVFIMCPVSRPFPQSPVKYDGSGDLDISVPFMYLAPVLDQSIFYRESFGQEKRESRSFIHKKEKSEFFAELTVISCLCFF